MAEIIRGKFPPSPKGKSKTAVKKPRVAAYQLKIDLLYCHPSIWRRIQVPGDMTLARLHEVIQLCMGWTDTHLHQFLINTDFYGPRELDDGWSERKILDEGRYQVSGLEADLRQRCMYMYDFGDGWEHEITVEKVLTPDEKLPRYPVLLAGERACPPEDVGGPPGYENFLAAMNSSPKSREYKEMRAWYGYDYDPAFVPIDGINKLLKKMK